MSNQLTFQAVTLTPIIHNNQTFITSNDLARALQYANAQSIANIYNRNADEFTHGMVEVINSVTSGNLQTTQRIFSLRGCHLIAMFARTPVAKAFRKWVLDILDKEVLQNPVAIPPLDPNQIQLSKDKYIALLERLVGDIETSPPARYGRKLNSKEKQHILELHAQGYLVPDIMERTGRSASAVRTTIAKHRTLKGE